MPRLLIVDDDLLSIELLSVFLRRHGFDVISATDGLTGLYLASHESPDVIILDYLLPDLDGTEVCQRFRTLTATSHIPIVLYSATSLPTETVQIVGANAFILKGNSLYDVEQVLTQVIASQKPLGL